MTKEVFKAGQVTLYVIEKDIMDVIQKEKKKSSMKKITVAGEPALAIFNNAD